MARHWMFSYRPEIVRRHRRILEQILESSVDREMILVRCGRKMIGDCSTETRRVYQRLISIV